MSGRKESSHGRGGHRRTARTRAEARAGPTPAQRDRANEIADRLIRAWPEARCRLDHSSPFELLVAAVLAAQCTDDKVNEVTPALFREAPTPQALAAMNWKRLEALIHPTGFYRSKRKNLQKMAAALVEKHGGRVPADMDALLALPGVARKTANMVRAVAFGLPGIICDTHVIRLSRRLGLTEEKRPEKIEADLQALLPPEKWTAFSHALQFHGRAVCTARKAACDRCVVADLCPSAYTLPPFAK